MAVVPAADWFDMWHAHLNHEGAHQRWANLLNLWAEVDTAGRASGRPWQSWVVLQPTQPRDDAVYLHTPNPNRDNFPYLFEGVTWEAELPSWAAQDVGLEFGRSNHDGFELLWVRRRRQPEPDVASSAAGVEGFTRTTESFHEEDL